MERSDDIQDIIEKRWSGTCKVVFGQEIGSIRDYTRWLKEKIEPIVIRTSSISGKKVAYAIPNYSENSKWIGLEEIGNSKFPPLSINEIKDIESIVSAIKDRIYYTGNIVLGNSGFIYESSSISDSFYMYHTGKFGDSKYLAFCTLGRLCEDCFGCNGIGESHFCIKAYETFRVKRSFEFWMGQNCSDCYYTHNLSGCSDCIFSFNLKNKHFAIGNCTLPKDKYLSIKNSLLEQLRDWLIRKKRAPSLLDLIPLSIPPKLPRLAAESKNSKVSDLGPIEEGFAKTCQIIFGKRLSGKLDDYADWLSKHVRKHQKLHSAISGEQVCRWDYSNYFMLPQERIVSQGEALALGEILALSKDEIDTISLNNVGGVLGKIAFFSTEYAEGTNINVIDCPTPTQSSNCYRTSPVVYSKYCAYSFWPRSSQYIFGSNAIFDSEFCIHCYHSVKLKRCFEMDSCNSCYNSYFCHNCENVSDSMFCFNAKNLRYAIGNVEVGQEQFLKIKNLLLSKILAELEAKKKFDLNIYNIGQKK
ncbi:MAG: hypothetical protein QXN37_02080 [Candidatus Anstonellaceae archaeon]